MKRFRYSMQRVLEIRDAWVSRHEASVAESERDLEACCRDQRLCTEAVRAFSRQAESQAVPGNGLSLRECLAQRAWYCHLLDRLWKSSKAVAEQTACVDQRREQLRQAVIDRSVLETMSHHERRRWLAHWSEMEAKRMDEAATSVYLRNRRADAEEPHESGDAGVNR